MCKWQFFWYLAGELISFIRLKNSLIFTGIRSCQFTWVFPYLTHQTGKSISSSRCLQESEGGLTIFTCEAEGGLGCVFIEVFVNCLRYKWLSFITTQLSFMFNICIYILVPPPLPPDILIIKVKLRFKVSTCLRFSPRLINSAKGCSVDQTEY